MRLKLKLSVDGVRGGVPCLRLIHSNEGGCGSRSSYDLRDRGVNVGADGVQPNEIRRERLNGRVVAVTVTSPPFGTNSETFFSRFGRVAASSCGGAWK